MDDLTALMSFLRKHPSMSSATVAERRAAYDRAMRGNRRQRKLK